MTSRPGTHSPRRHYAHRLLLLGLPALVLALAFAGSAGAHGGGKQQLAREALGPFLVYVWTSPDPWRVGEAHTTVAVTTLLADGQETPATSAEVFVTYTHAGRSERVPAVEQIGAQTGFYEADGPVATAGEWQVTVEVAGEVGGATGGGEVSFVETVQAANELNWWLVGGATLLALLVLGYLGTRKSGGKTGVRSVQRGASS